MAYSVIRARTFEESTLAQDDSDKQPDGTNKLGGRFPPSDDLFVILFLSPLILSTISSRVIPKAGDKTILGPGVTGMPAT